MLVTTLIYVMIVAIMVGYTKDKEEPKKVAAKKAPAKKTTTTKKAPAKKKTTTKKK